MMNIQLIRVWKINKKRHYNKNCVNIENRGSQELRFFLLLNFIQATKPKDFLSDDFLKQFKTGQQLNDFLGQIQKRAIEKMLEGELDGHLGYEKNDQDDGKMRVMVTGKED